MIAKVATKPLQQKREDESVDAVALGGGWKVLRALGSPRLTSTLFVLAIILIFLGTLAQVYQDMWEVIDNYFRAWIAWVDLKILFPPSFFPWAIHTDWDAFAFKGFPFPGGALIGSVLFVNLLAAQSTRFKLKARGARLVAGLVVLAVGVAVTWLVIASGHNRQGLQGEPVIGWSTLWTLIRYGLAVLWLGCVGTFVYVWRSGRSGRKIELAILAGSSLGLAVLLFWLVTRGDTAALNDSSLRILYQLIQGQVAASILLVACVLLFYKRAGIALLHAGVGLLMFGEFFVSHFAVEQQITLREGQSVGYARDIRSVELAISAQDGGRNRVVAVPIMNTGKPTSYAFGKTIENEDLPFSIEFIEYFENSKIRTAQPQDSNLANKGAGKRYLAVPETPRGGVKGGQVDYASAYARFADKATGADLGTYLLSQHFSSDAMPQSIRVDGREFDLDLRFKHDVKPYKMTLVDVRKDDYTGTAMARNYSSFVKLVDPSRGVEFETKIWMNNPLRYAGETFYQSGYDMDSQGIETSVLQVVRNTGWMIPYVSCMIAATGMFAHFFVLLLRFLQRIQGREEAESTEGEEAKSTGGAERATRRLWATRRSDGVQGIWKWLVPATTVALGLVWIGTKAMPPRTPKSEMQVEQFGELPVMYEGRVKPLDTLARNSLRVLSNRETYVDATGDRGPAIRWLLDVIARPSVAQEAKVFRIDSLEVLATFGLERRRGFRYSWDELRGGLVDFHKEVSLARQKPAEERTYFQRKVLDLSQRINRYRTISDSFRPLQLPPFPAKSEVAEDSAKAAREVAAVERLVKQIPSINRALESRQPPLAAPVGPADQPWLAYAAAQNQAHLNEYYGTAQPPEVLTAMAAIFENYEQQNRTGFNRAVADYRQLLASSPPAGYDPPMTDFEAYFNHCAPFFNLLPLYAVGMLLTVFGWLGAAWPRLSGLMRSSAFWLILCAFIVHTLALASRVAISGRPPVTNLYSSAIFIGWGCVLIGLVLEYLSRLGVGNLVSAITGIGALIVAHVLAGDGDTIRVLQAVLDTQFWLTTHVLTITLGYSATFLAGLLGIILVAWYVLGKPLSRAIGKLDSSGAPQASFFSQIEKVMSSMIFGVICFAAFFSFVGTVLGGLWADDSWGRFWGWDPKENGALIIVLWTTLVLHAYGARLVRERGLALLAIGGNIVTAWSWFGVNELGVGLHSYGFTEGAARALLIFWTSQILIIGVGLVPVFWSMITRHRANEQAAAVG